MPENQNTNDVNENTENTEESKIYKNNHSETESSVTKSDESSENNSQKVNIKELLKELNDIKEQNHKLTISLARVQNDAKMIAKKADEKSMYALSGITKDLTSILNTFSLAISSLKSGNPTDNETNNHIANKCIEGMEMIMKEFISSLSKHNIEIINSSNGMFDSNLHEAISMIKHNSPKGSIVNLAQIGSLLNNRLIVPAKVIVSAGNESDEQ